MLRRFSAPLLSSRADAEVKLLRGLRGGGTNGLDKGVDYSLIWSATPPFSASPIGSVELADKFLYLSLVVAAYRLLRRRRTLSGLSSISF